MMSAYAVVTALLLVSADGGPPTFHRLYFNTPYTVEECTRRLPQFQADLKMMGFQAHAFNTSCYATVVINPKFPSWPFQPGEKKGHGL